MKMIVPEWFIVDPYVPNAPFLYPLKTSKNLTGALGTNDLIQPCNV